jgi:pyruvate dehydrogenase E1 component alpha subunit
MVFVCENSSPEVQRMLGHEIDYPQLSIERVSDRAQAYGIPGATYDGWDVLDVFEAVLESVRRAREGGGPTLLEFNVHQIEGNLEGRIEAGDDEITWCPIHRFKEIISNEGILTAGLDEKIRDEEKSRVEEAVDYALRSPVPEPIEAFKGVFAGGP